MSEWREWEILLKPMPDDTTSFTKAKSFAGRHKGALSSTAGGVSLVTLFAVFATQSDLNRVDKYRADGWRETQELRAEVDRLKWIVMQRAEIDSTNGFAVLKEP